MVQTVTLRPSARLVIGAPERRALLFRFCFPERTFWEAPGGALGEREDYAAPARCELREETRIEAEVETELFRRETTYRGLGGMLLYADERYVADRVPAAEIDTGAWEPIEQEMILETPWLTPETIRLLTDPGFPENSADLVERVLQEEG